MFEEGVAFTPGDELAAFERAGGFTMTTDDAAEMERPIQSVGYFLIGADGVIRWSDADWRITPLPPAEELVALLR